MSVYQSPMTAPAKGTTSQKHHPNQHRGNGGPGGIGLETEQRWEQLPDDQEEAEHPEGGRNQPRRTVSRAAS